MLRGVGRQLDNVLEERICSKFRVQAVSKNNMEPIDCLETSVNQLLSCAMKVLTTPSQEPEISLGDRTLFNHFVVK